MRPAVTDALVSVVAVLALAGPLPAQFSAEQLARIMEEAVSRQRQAAAATERSASAVQVSVARQVESNRRQEQSAVRAGAMALSSQTAGAASIPDPGEAPGCDPIPAAEAKALISAAAEREGLDPDLLYALIEQESAFLPCAVSSKGALGLTQLMPATAAQFGADDPFDPKQNIDAAARFLSLLLTRYDSDLALVLGAYNAGPARVEEAGGVPDIPETRNYVHQILDRLSRRRTSSKEAAPSAPVR